MPLRLRLFIPRRVSLERLEIIGLLHSVDQNTAMVPLKLTTVGTSTGVVIPEEVLTRLKLGQGDAFPAILPLVPQREADRISFPVKAQ